MANPELITSLAETIAACDTDTEVGPNVIADPSDISTFPTIVVPDYKIQHIIDDAGNLLGYVDEDGYHLIQATGMGSVEPQWAIKLVDPDTGELIQTLQPDENNCLSLPYCCIKSELSISCAEETITDQKQQLQLVVSDPDAVPGRMYFASYKGCPVTPARAGANLSTVPLSAMTGTENGSGSISIDLNYYDNGDACNPVTLAASCSVNYNVACAQSFSSALNVSNNAGVNDPYRRHFYATRSSFNANSTCLVLQEGANEGQTLANTHKVYDLQGTFKYTLPFNRDVIWSRFDSDVSYGVINQNSTSSIARYNAATNQTTILYSQQFVQGEILEIGARKGALSYDERCTVINDEENIKVVDLCTGQVTATMPSSVLSNGGNVSGAGTSLYISPKCKYVITFESDGNGSQDMYRYDIDLSNRTLLTTNGNHFDVGLDHNGKEVVVQVGNPPQMIDLDTGTSTTLHNGAAFGHVSASGAPGQFVFSSSINGDRKILSVNSADGASAFANGDTWVDLGNWNATNFRSQRKVNISPDGCNVIWTEGPDGSNQHDDFIVTRTCN